MTEILRAFWKEKRPERIAVLVSGILFAVIFWIYEIPVEIAGYAFLLVILWNVIWFTLVFIRYEKRQRILEENQGKIRTEAGGFPEAESRESEMYQELIRQLYEEKTMMAEKIQSTLVNTIPLWKSQMVLALGVEHSAQAAAAQREVNDMTNELLRKNAEKLKIATVETAKESERGIVDIETLKATNESLIATFDEVMQIQQEGRQKRQQAEVEMQRIEAELKAKLLQVQG